MPPRRPSSRNDRNIGAAGQLGNAGGSLGNAGGPLGNAAGPLGNAGGYSNRQG